MGVFSFRFLMGFGEQREWGGGLGRKALGLRWGRGGWNGWDLIG